MHPRRSLIPAKDMTAPAVRRRRGGDRFVPAWFCATFVGVTVHPPEVASA
jgi:hypothetical protein